MFIILPFFFYYLYELINHLKAFFHLKFQYEYIFRKILIYSRLITKINEYLGHF
jgi:hypothetical protein